ncbi:MAG: AAA family ATPase [Candidatus Pacebacteria bacterium]|nr:AAA family ATPase [Candidatus Paceibacterota bacterium]
MKIKNIRIKNLLSFSEEAENIIDADDFNLFIGPNNEGKSNVLKSIQFLFSIFEFYGGPHNELLGLRIDLEHFIQRFPFLKESKSLFFNQNADKKISFSFILEFNDGELEKCLKHISPSPYKDFFENIMSSVTQMEIFGIIYKDDDKHYLRINKISFPQLIQPEFNTLFNFETKELVKNNNSKDPGSYKLEKVEESEFNEYVGSTISPFITALFHYINEHLKNSLIPISSVRTIEEYSYNSESNHREFSKVAEKIMKLRDGLQDERKKFKEIKEFIRRLAYPGIKKENLDEIEITFSRDGKKHCLKLNVGDKIFPLSQLGSGIEQLVFLAAEILVEDDNKIFLIEEPETNFHPKLQRAFIRFLQEDLKSRNHQFFITSHSSIFVDSFINNENSKIFQIKLVTDKKPEYTEVIAISDEKYFKNVSSLFYELGVKGIDLLQTNGIIWVEGPSDRIYLLKWFELYHNKRIKKDIESRLPKEGRDFSILFYGGSILSSFTLEEKDVDENDLKQEENDFIDLLKINRNAVVLMDRDLETGKNGTQRKELKKK